MINDTATSTYCFLSNLLSRLMLQLSARPAKTLFSTTALFSAGRVPG